jgi:hypothetical protein
MNRGERCHGWPLTADRSRPRRLAMRAACALAALALSSCAAAPPPATPAVDLRLDFLSPSHGAPLPYLGPMMPDPPAAVIAEWNPQVYSRREIDGIALQQCIGFGGYARAEGPVTRRGPLLAQRFVCIAWHAPLADPAE